MRCQNRTVWYHWLELWDILRPSDVVVIVPMCSVVTYKCLVSLPLVRPDTPMHVPCSISIMYAICKFSQKSLSAISVRAIAGRRLSYTTSASKRHACRLLLGILPAQYGCQDHTSSLGLRDVLSVFCTEAEYNSLLKYQIS